MEPHTIDPLHQHPNSIALLPQFRTFRVPYKHINGHPIHAFFIVPNDLPTGPRPLFVRFHGGGFVEGEAEASMRPFFLEMALKHGAVIVTPDYRLRPEHEMLNSLEDIKSFWQWIEDGSAQSALTSSLPDITFDANNLIVAGESAGGYMTVQTALLGMTKLHIRVLFVQYPALDLDAITRTHDLDENVLKTGVWAESVPYSEVEDAINAATKEGTICTRAPFATRMRLMMGLVQAGRFSDMEKEGSIINPMQSLETAGKMPPILLYHSKEDEAVPWQHTEKWAARLRELQPDVQMHLQYTMGDHVFDKNDTMAASWLKEPLEFVQKYWPA